MNIGLIGYGRMGKLIKSIAEGRGHAVRTIDPHAAGSDYDAITAEALAGIDVCIDFSHPETAAANMRAVAKLGKNLVVGTTGWYGKLDEVRGLVDEAGIGFLYASNFSIGVNAFARIVSRAAEIFNRIDAYDVCGVEYHHRKKADSPSGTAQSLGRALLEQLERKDKLVFDIVNRPIEPNELHFASVRCGAIPGTHEISFDSDADTISLRHTARNREGFAYGAVIAAEWLKGRHGFFGIDDLMNDLLGPASSSDCAAPRRAGEE